MPTYIHQREEWPDFRWDWSAVAGPLAAVRLRQGALLGKMENVGFPVRQSSLLEALTQEVQKSSEIEGQLLERDDVRSSLARRLGLDVASIAPQDRRIEAIVEMALDATQRYAEPLTAERLKGWQAALFPLGYSGIFRIKVGDWRDSSIGPMQVVSGVIGRERVHFEAPDADRIPIEMERFLNDFESSPHDGVLTAALAHLWFVTIHPFEDGNGRIARAITELALARSEASELRFYSMSAQIRKERRRYYDILERTQKGTLDVTAWLVWFLGCLERAIAAAELELAAVIAKAGFWDAHRATPVNERQRAMLNRLLDGFEGKLTTKKWSQLTRSSHDTALRDIQDLIAKGILLQQAGGRSTSYELRDP